MLENFPSELFSDGQLTPFVVLSLLIVSLSLIFYGRTVAKSFVFIISGISGAYLGAAVGAYYGGIMSLLATVAGFLLGGLLGVFLLSVGIGLALAMYAYDLARTFAGNPFVPIVVAAAVFLMGVAFSGSFLSITTTVVGSLLLYDLALVAGLDSQLATIIIPVVAVAGLWVQLEFGKRNHSPARSAGRSRVTATT